METESGNARDALIQMQMFHDRHCKSIHGLSLLDRAHTLELLRYACNKGLKLWGIDAIIVHLDDNNVIIGVQPDMAYGFDFDRQTISEAISILENLDDRYHFEFLEWIGSTTNTSK